MDRLKMLRLTCFSRNKVGDADVIRRESCRSNMSLQLAEVAQLHERSKKQESKQRADLFKMIFVIAWPIVALLTVTIMNTDRSLEQLDVIRLSGTRMQDYLAVIKEMQKERGMTAFYLGSGENEQVFANLQTQRAATDVAVHVLNELEWTDMHLENITLFSNEELVSYILQHRDRINTDPFNVSVNQNINFYTDIIQVFIGFIRRSLENPSGSVWKTYVAMSAVVSATDSAGIQRALGSTMFALCSAEFHDYFIDLESAHQVDLKAASQYREQTQASLDHRLDSDPMLIPNIRRMKAQITSYEVENLCSNASNVDNIELGQFWFANMTAYLGHVLAEVTAITQEISSAFDDDISVLTNDVILQASILAVSTVMCFVITAWYITCLRRMMSHVQGIAQHSLQMSNQLGDEQRKTARLLYEILPKGIARESNRRSPSLHVDL